MNPKEIFIRYKNATAIILAFICLVVGGLIYIGFRSKELLLSKFTIGIGLSELVEMLRTKCASISFPEWIIYSLPDALWLTAYLLTINAIVNTKQTLFYKFFIYIMPAISIASELLQLIGLCPGTFDKYDLICYIIPTLILTPLRHEI